MSPASISRRLEHVSQLFSRLPPDSPRVDMTPKGITRRLREAAALYRLAARLHSSKKDEDVAPPEAGETEALIPAAKP